MSTSAVVATALGLWFGAVAPSTSPVDPPLPPAAAAATTTATAEGAQP